MPTDAVSDVPPSSSRSYRLLDAFRGVAALWVVMIHAALPVVNDPNMARTPLYAFSMWGGLGVTMFFVISGYCIAAAAESALRKPAPLVTFLQARLRRIYPPYFVSSIITIFFNMFVARLASQGALGAGKQPPPFFGESLRFYFASLTLTQIPLHIEPISTVYWSLCYEIAFYGLIDICIGIALATARKHLATGLGVLTLLSTLWLIVWPQTCPFPLNLWSQFGLGVLVYMMISKPDDRMIRILFASVLTLMAVFRAIHQGSYSPGHASSRVETFFCIGFALVLWQLHRFDSTLAKNRVVKGLEWLGVFSYSLYLSHFFVIPFVRQIGKRLGFAGGHYWVSYMLQIVVAVAVAYLFHVLFERPFLSKKAKLREVTISTPEFEVAR